MRKTIIFLQYLTIINKLLTSYSEKKKLVGDLMSLHHKHCFTTRKNLPIWF